ncbi:hypothetical protein N5U22_00860 [Aliarcobacter cryaerophilus]|uniref:hypothetical protein n=1 Tax=Aliarcobacter cryaerophilus TaxID=28198 RepID=UPI0021B56D79|nr:hypothetical protein [Aliarcobacter cryaerophilus]MCT7531952.1 hypothetical protein [Aliarcobacter cryaerophilus]
MNKYTVQNLFLFFLMILPIISLYAYMLIDNDSKKIEENNRKQKVEKEIIENFIKNNTKEADSKYQIVLDKVLNTKSDFSKYLEKENIKIYTVKDYDREYIKFISYINKQSNTEEIK